MGRTAIINQIKKQLPDYIFENNRFQMNTTRQAPVQEMYINNQRYAVPGRSISIDKLIEVREDGYLQDEVSTRHFTQVYFAIFVNNEIQQDVEICCFWDDMSDLLNVLENFK